MLFRPTAARYAESIGAFEGGQTGTAVQELACAEQRQQVVHWAARCARLRGGVAAREGGVVAGAALQAHRLPVGRARWLPVQRHQLAKAVEGQASLERLQAAGSTEQDQWQPSLYGCDEAGAGQQTTTCEHNSTPTARRCWS